MSTVKPEQLLQLYTREDITDEQALGHVLQNLVIMHKAQQKMQMDIERLMAFVGMEQEKQDEDDAA